MISNINPKLCKYSMKRFSKLFFIVIMFTLFIGTTYSVDEVTLNWRLDEGAGFLALDSINNNYGVINHATFDLGIKYAGQSSLKCDNVDDYLTSVNSLDLNGNSTFNFWAYRKDEGGYVTMFTLHSASKEYFKLEYNKDTTLFRVSYLDNTSVVQSVTFTDNYVKDVWRMFTFSVSHDENRIIIKKGGTQIYNNVMSQPFKDQVENVYFKMCNNLLNTVELDMYIDEVTVLNFIPNSTVSSLLLSNDIDTINSILELRNGNGDGDDGNETPNLDNVTGIEPLNIIKTFNPANNSVTSNLVTISYTTYFNSNCDLYIDNDYVKTFINKVSGTYTDNLEQGNHTYSLYCYVLDEGVLKYDFLDKVRFSIELLQNGTITFFVTGNDYDVNSLDLYLVTPCIKYTATVGELGQESHQDRNKDGTFYFQKLVNGGATFTLPQGEQEFCLLNGFVQYSENGYTQDFNINNLYGFNKIGKISVPSNVTASYTIQTDLYDVYDKLDPKAYNVSWASLISSLILILIGFVTLSGGLSNNNGKIAVAGALLILAGCGVAFNGLLGVLV